MIRYIDQCLETVENEIRRKSTKEHPVTQLDLIFDMNNLSFWQLASKKSMSQKKHFCSSLKELKICMSLKNASCWINAAIETILEVVRRYEANHPEILHKAYVINGILI